MSTRITMSHWVVLFIIGFGYSTTTTAQYQVSGSFKESNGSPVPYANILLLHSADSTLEKGQVTDEKGRFIVETATAGHYLVSIKFIGYEDVFSRPFELNNAKQQIDLGEFTGKEKATQLDEVSIEAERPLFEQKIDRTVVNVGSNISASGGSALDVLSRSPGVTVDRMNNTISLAGKQGIRIMINGKISQIPLDAAVQMLDGMNAENVERIELITTPPAKYEAEGDAGMINIVMKKETDTGANGNLSLFTGYGKKEKYGGSINFNNRGKKANLYGDYSYRNNVTEQLIALDRQLLINGAAEVTDTENNRSAFTRVHNGRLGVDWNITNKTSIGGQLSFFDRLWEMDALADIYTQTDGTPSGFTEMDTFERNGWLLLIGNLNITHTFNDRHNLSVDVDRIDYDSDNPTDYLQKIYDAQFNPTSTEVLRSRKETPIKTWVGKIDYSVKISDKVTVEAGAKGSFSKLENDILVEDQQDGQFTTDPSLTSKADMYENIGAGYLSSTINVSEKIDVQLGIRHEYTRTNIDTEEQDNVVDRRFGNWFPSVFFQNKINKNNSWVLSYSRRVSRPSFFQIAPFVIFIDPNSFWSGNISLLPSLTDAVKAEYRYKSALASLQYSYDKDAISPFQPRINQDNKQVSTAENLTYRKTYSVNLSFPIPITEWWEWQFNISGNWIELKADFFDEPIDLSIKNFSGNGSTKFKLPKKLTLEVSGFYRSKQLFGVYEWKAFGSVNLGLEKKFTNSQLRLAYNDIFKTNNWGFGAQIPEENINMYTYLNFETNILTITYSTSFGNRKLKVKRRSTGSEEEQQRFQ